jgi:predicted ArsR family transcriptional regulator
MTVRQHLTALGRDGLVRTQEVRRQTGRPHYLYQLTLDGHRRVLDGHDRMLVLLVEQAGLIEPAESPAASPQERRRTLFTRAADALAERHGAEIRALSGAAQAAQVVALLRSHGGFADWHQAEDGYEIRDFGCVYRASVDGGGACSWHETLLARVTGARVYAGESIAACADCCRYVVVTTTATTSSAQPRNGYEHH